MLGNLVAQHKKSMDGINWLSFEQLSDSLAMNPKKVLLFFHTDWCAYCRKMERESFAEPEIIEKINKDYYAVHFDAESIDTVYFDGNYYTNSSPVKKTGRLHHLTKIFSGNQKRPAFPITLLLDKDFKVIQRKNNYLSIKDLIKIL